MRNINSFEAIVSDKIYNANTFVICTISYNNPETLRLQIQNMNRLLTDEFHHVIIDNNSPQVSSDKIKSLALSQNRSYIRLNHNFHVNPSHSHALALDWCYKNVIVKNKIHVFGFLDHDIYPIRKSSIYKILMNQNVYGHLQERENYWYLWPGFLFFNFNNNWPDITFQPGSIGGVNVDTGGLLYHSVYKNIDRTTIHFCSHTYKSVGTVGAIQNQKVELMDDWVHSFNASNWMNSNSDNRNIESILKELELSNG
jgi:glycosyltransferase involved in cell wall biosynthesis